MQSTTLAGADERSQLKATVNNLILHLHPARVPAGALRFSYTWGLGGISTLLVLIQLVTGVLLLFHYEATVERAYASIQYLEAEVAFGSLVRAMHHWSANLLVVTVFLHLLRVFYTGGFKQGRTANWLIGLLLLGLVLAFNFTGYLLPWDQLAYWAITVSSSLISYIPLMGEAITRFLLAGPEVGQTALRNFYALHVAVLPGCLLLAMAYHFWKIRKNGGLSQPVTPARQRAPKVTTLPHLVEREFAAATVVLTGLLLWSMAVAAPLEALANPVHSPNPAKAAWYFAGLQELLLHMDALAAMSLVGLVLLGLLLLPRWDRRSEDIGLYFRSAVGRRAALLGALLAIDVTPLLVIADEYWLDLPRQLPAWPTFVAAGLFPLGLSLAGLVVIYVGLRWLTRANHSEALAGLFSFVMAALVILTIIGVFFRGPNMALVLPF
ncbi:MAG: hypothetical protein Kow0031_05760 [Anaerolineae bacterium]